MDETQLQTLCDWLRTAPALAGVGTLWVDDAPAVPGTAGLFPAGVQVTERRVNLLGEVRLRCRASFTLRLVLPYDGQSTQPNAATLLAFQRWVLEQSAAGLAPVFGNTDTARERLTAADAKLERVTDEGTAVYAVQLKAEYTLQY